MDLGWSPSDSPTSPSSRTLRPGEEHGSNISPDSVGVACEIPSYTRAGESRKSHTHRRDPVHKLGFFKYILSDMICAG